MTNKFDIYCIGIKVVLYSGTMPGDESFDYEDAECVKDILCCYVDDYCRSKFEIELETQYGWCGSGYCEASWGVMNCRFVDSFGTLTHVPKDNKPIKIKGAYFDYADNDWHFDRVDYDFYDEINNNVFYCDEVGGDEYYPSGRAGVHRERELFKELPRAFKQRPVWIFKGESATGKSTLAHILTADKKVYETDSAKMGILPDKLWCDVIVIGNKWPITVDDIRKRLVDAEVIVVDFSRG